MVVKRTYFDSGVWQLMGVMGLVIGLSNVLVQHPLGNWLTAGAFTYPFAFLVTDLANRKYGVKVAQKVVIVGFIIGIVASFVAAQFDVSTWRIAIGSAAAFLTAQFLDIALFNRLRKLSWWKTPVISSVIGSVVDTFLFFSIAFSAATFVLMSDGNDWALETVPLLNVGPEYPLWVSLAVADLGIKLILLPLLLIPYRILTTPRRIAS